MHGVRGVPHSENARLLLDHEGSALAVDELLQSLHPVARLSVKPKTEAETVKAEAGGSQGGRDVSAGGHGASVSGAADADRAVALGLWHPEGVDASLFLETESTGVVLVAARAAATAGRCR